MNKNILINKYKDLVSFNKNDFINDVNFFKNKLNLNSFTTAPVLIYNRNKRNALYYTLCIYYSLKDNRVLDYSVITGQTLINQHFMTEESRDPNVYNAAFYSDITFISLSQFDYTSEYLRKSDIDLVEFRNINKKITVISYDILDLNKVNLYCTDKKLQSYFSANRYTIIDLERKFPKNCN
jgi:hypothetical protein